MIVLVCGNLCLGVSCSFGSLICLLVFSNKIVVVRLSDWVWFILVGRLFEDVNFIDVVVLIYSIIEWVICYFFF